MHSFTDGSYNPTYLALNSYNGGVYSEVFYEYVYLDPH